jgi:hypothetical protein
VLQGADLAAAMIVSAQTGEKDILEIIESLMSKGIMINLKGK